jgi:hypothetical protein
MPLPLLLVHAAAAAALGMSLSAPAMTLRTNALPVAVLGAPPNAAWFRLDSIGGGPPFSGFPCWFSTLNHTVSWWSEYFDRDDPPRAHGYNTSATPMQGSLVLRLSAWTDRSDGSSGARCLASATSTVVVRYDMSYTRLHWDVSATPLAASPGTVRLGLTAHDDSKSRAAATATERVWWFEWRPAATQPAQPAAAQFVEGGVMAMLPAAPAEWLVSLSEPGLHFFGVWGSFNTHPPQMAGGSDQGGGFVSHTAPLVRCGNSSELSFQPVAVSIPFANGSVAAALPVGFCGDHIRLPPIPGDLRVSLPVADDDAQRPTITMFDGGTLTLTLLFGGAGVATGVEFVEFEMPPCVKVLSNTRVGACAYNVSRGSSAGGVVLAVGG